MFSLWKFVSWEFAPSHHQEEDHGGSSWMFCPLPFGAPHPVMKPNMDPKTGKRSRHMQIICYYSLSNCSIETLTEHLYWAGSIDNWHHLAYRGDIGRLLVNRTHSCNPFSHSLQTPKHNHIGKARAVFSVFEVVNTIAVCCLKLADKYIKINLLLLWKYIYLLCGSNMILYS